LGGEAFLRFAQEDLELDGISFRAGDRIIPSLVAANRDPAVFDNPDRFDIDRQPSRHLAFGYGQRHCLGSAMARVMLRDVFSILPARFPRLRMDASVEGIPWIVVLMDSVPESMPTHIMALSTRLGRLHDTLDAKAKNRTHPRGRRISAPASTVERRHSSVLSQNRSVRNRTHRAVGDYSPPFDPGASQENNVPSDWSPMPALPYMDGSRSGEAIATGTLCSSSRWGAGAASEQTANYRREPIFDKAGPDMMHCRPPAFAA
jgi:hypothetical protein